MVRGLPLLGKAFVLESLFVSKFEMYAKAIEAWCLLQV